MKPKIWIIIVTTLVVINVATLAFLWMHHRGRGKGEQGASTKDFIIHQVGLTAVQQLQYDSLRRVHIQLIQAADLQDRELHDQLFTTVSRPVADSVLIDSLAAKISMIDMQRQKITVYHFRDLRGILTPTQQQKFDNILTDAARIIGRPAPPQGRPGPEGGDDGPPPHP